MEPSESSSETSSSSSSETSSGSRYLVPETADAHQFYDPKLDAMVRDLMKFPVNQLCVNCNSEGPQYFCTNICAFVCKTCSEVHQEFGHMVKSVSDKFTFEEVNTLVYRRGNQELLNTRDETSLPDNSDVVRLRKFIRRCYVDGRSGDTDEDVMEEVLEKMMNAKGKAHEEEGSGRKRKIEEVATGLREIPDLPALSEMVLKLRGLCLLTVGASLVARQPVFFFRRDASYLRHPYPWKDMSIEEMAKNGINTVEGEVRCLSCKNLSIASLDWKEAWVKSASYMFANFISFGEEVFSRWTPPSDIHIECGFCFEVKAVPSLTSTMEINWLFLFLTNTVSMVSVLELENYIRSRGIKLSPTPSKKELMSHFYMDMLRLLDPKGGWAGFNLTPRDDELI